MGVTYKGMTMENAEIIKELAPLQGDYGVVTRGFNYIWPNIEQLEADFFSYIKKRQEENRFPNIVSFCLYAGVDQEAFCDFLNQNSEHRPRVRRMLKTASESFLVERLGEGRGNPVGAIFLLKNWFKYVDKQEIENRTTININNVLEQIEGSNSDIIDGEIEEENIPPND